MYVTDRPELNPLESIHEPDEETILLTATSILEETYATRVGVKTMITQTVEEKILNTQFVDADYFLLRIHEFENKYGWDWVEFERLYKADDNLYLNRDFNEWAFLCRNFREELLAADTESPPGDCAGRILEKPDFESGFFIRWEQGCSILMAIFGRLKTCCTAVRL